MPSSPRRFPPQWSVHSKGEHPDQQRIRSFGGEVFYAHQPHTRPMAEMAAAGATEVATALALNAHRGASIVLKARCVAPILGSDIGTRSFGLDPLAPVITNGEPHCFGLLI